MPVCCTATSPQATKFHCHLIVVGVGLVYEFYWYCFPFLKRDDHSPLPVRSSRPRLLYVIDGNEGFMQLTDYESFSSFELFAPIFATIIFLPTSKPFHSYSDLVMKRNHQKCRISSIVSWTRTVWRFCPVYCLSSYPTSLAAWFFPVVSLLCQAHWNQ